GKNTLIQSTTQRFPLFAVPFGDVCGGDASGGVKRSAHIQIGAVESEGVHLAGYTAAEGGPVGAVPRGNAAGWRASGYRERATHEKSIGTGNHGRHRSVQSRWGFEPWVPIPGRGLGIGKRGIRQDRQRWTGAKNKPAE